MAHTREDILFVIAARAPCGQLPSHFALCVLHVCVLCGLGHERPRTPRARRGLESKVLIMLHNQNANEYAMMIASPTTFTTVTSVTRDEGAPAITPSTPKPSPDAI